jgi:hypothetical protein
MDLNSNCSLNSNSLFELVECRKRKGIEGSPASQPAHFSPPQPSPKPFPFSPPFPPRGPSPGQPFPPARPVSPLSPFSLWRAGPTRQLPFPPLLSFPFLCFPRRPTASDPAGDSPLWARTPRSRRPPLSGPATPTYPCPNSAATQNPSTTGLLPPSAAGKSHAAAQFLTAGAPRPC